MLSSTLNKCLEMLAVLTGMQVGFYDSSFRFLASFPSKETAHFYCSEIHKKRECYNLCFQSDIDSFTRAEKLGTVYSYTCPFGLEEIIAPVVIDGKAQAYIFLGKTIKSSDEKKEIALRMASKFFPHSEEKFREIVSGIKNTGEKEIEAYCMLAGMTAQYIENNRLYHFQSKPLAGLIKSFVDKNFQNRITLDTISLSLHCGTVTLTETFRKEFGITIMHYVRDKRLEYARALLSNSALPVGEIAALCGFPDAGYFTKVFTQVHGTPPTEWKNKAAAQDSDLSE